MPIHERANNLVVRLDDDEIEMAHAIATKRDVPVSQVIRQFIHDCYGALYGTAPPPKHRRRRGRPTSK